jgi:hypothetical protein
MFGCRSSPTRRRNEQWCSDPRLPRSSVPRKRKRAGRLELVHVGAVPELIATSIDLLTPTIIMSGGGGGGGGSGMGSGGDGLGSGWGEGGGDYFGAYSAAGTAQVAIMDAVATATTKRTARREKLLQQPLFARVAAATTAAAAAARPPLRVRSVATAASACASVGDVAAAGASARITPARFCFDGDDDVFGDSAAPLSSLSSSCRKTLSQPATTFRLANIINRQEKFPLGARKSDATFV